ncbi:MAG: HAD-IC family P-type ATPase [Bacteroidetes bacterium]|nr:HAD-IC family P-type ATPase [Bacteroidota bacterium]
MLIIPILFYSGSDFFKNSISALKVKKISIDVPLVLGIIALFGRSMYEVLSATGSGYFDTLAGLVFLLLTGRYFQNKVFNQFSFERELYSYFPLSVLKKTNSSEERVLIENLEEGDFIKIKNEEIIPCDAEVISDSITADLSFITGEAMAKRFNAGDKIYAGSKIVGKSGEFKVLKKTDKSYLACLWDEVKSSGKKEVLESLTGKFSGYFTALVLLIALSAFSYYWMNNNVSGAFNALTAVLLITCPCASALSAPMALGNAIRLLSRRGFYLKNAFVIEKVAGIKNIVLDKTGTITVAEKVEVTYVGNTLSEEEQSMIYSAVNSSNHPLSRILSDKLKHLKSIEPDAYEEIKGKGIEAKFKNNNLCIGSATFTKAINTIENKKQGSVVHIAINGNYKGYYFIESRYREGLWKMLNSLSAEANIYLLSGDHKDENPQLTEYFGKNMHFNQNPEGKKQYIQMLAESGKTMMVGDGINDGVALKVSDVGIAVSDNVNSFYPSAQIILDGKHFTELAEMIAYSRSVLKVIYACLALSFLYNIVGMYFACTLAVTPLFAAVLMPISSITVVSLAVGGTYFAYRRKFAI